MRIIIEIEQDGRVVATTEGAPATSQPEPGPAPTVAPAEAAGVPLDAGPPVPPTSLDEEVAERAHAEEGSGGAGAIDSGGPPDVAGEA